MIIRELITKFGFNVDDSALKKAEQKVDNFKKKADSVSRQTGYAHKSLAETLRAFDNPAPQKQMKNAAAESRKIADNTNEAAANIRQMAAAYLSFASAVKFSQVADAMQNLRARLQFVPQTVTDTGTALDQIAARAQASRAPLQAYANLYTRLAGATKNYFTTQEEVLDVTDAISGALKLNGATAQESASVTLQLSQAFQKGKLDGQEFSAFMEGTSVMFKEDLVVALREVTGNSSITLEGLRDMSANGQLLAKDLALAFKRMAPEIRKDLQSIPMTIGDAVQVVRDRFSLMIDRINRETFFVTKSAKAITDGFGFIEQAIITTSEAVGGFGNAMRVVIALLGLIFGSRLIGFLKQAAALFSLTTAGVVALALALEDLYSWVKGNKSITEDLIGPWREWRNKVMGYIDNVKERMGFGPNVVPIGANDPFQNTFMSYRMPNGIEKFSNAGLGAVARNLMTMNVNVTLPPNTTPDQAPVWMREINKAVDDTLARNIANTVGAR
jgi:tape measure domain-containing protein